MNNLIQLVGAMKLSGPVVPSIAAYRTGVDRLYANRQTKVEQYLRNEHCDVNCSECGGGDCSDCNCTDCSQCSGD